ncbi:hypothetical protein ACIBQX_08450 [Nonomuraea sp. NPDC049714]|uniref:hypothetical protein n=1 Tax=Nonomuraea sp. NPDC049714 TaxID=3364357 RepID=UPI0037A491D3
MPMGSLKSSGASNGRRASPELAIPALLALDADCHTVSQALQVLGGDPDRTELKEMLVRAEIDLLEP